MCLVAIASLAAGVLIGVWSIHTLDVWVRIAGRNAASSPDVVRRAPEESSWPHTPGDSSPERFVRGIGSCGRSHERNYRKLRRAGVRTGTYGGRDPEKTEEWPQVEQGCRLGNYQRTSRCRAAELAVDGWGDTKPIPLNDLAKFCDANYLEQSLALCLVTHGGDDRSASSRSSSGHLIRLLMAFQRLMFFRNCAATEGTREEGRLPKESWSEVAPLCARGVYAPASPKCEASAILTDRRPVDARVPYSEVAAFCDVNLLTRESEICRAAYRLIQSTDDSAR